MKSKRFIKMYSLTTLVFTALTAASGVFVIVLEILRGARHAQIIHTSIPITGSTMEDTARFFLNLWTSPVSAILLGLSLIFSLLWLYANIKHVKKAATKFKEVFSERAESFFS